MEKVIIGEREAVIASLLEDLEIEVGNDDCFCSILNIFDNLIKENVTEHGVKISGVRGMDLVFYLVVTGNISLLEYVLKKFDCINLNKKYKFRQGTSLLQAATYHAKRCTPSNTEVYIKICMILIENNCLIDDYSYNNLKSLKQSSKWFKIEDSLRLFTDDIMSKIKLYLEIEDTTKSKLKSNTNNIIPVT